MYQSICGFSFRLEDSLWKKSLIVNKLWYFTAAPWLCWHFRCFNGWLRQWCFVTCNHFWWRLYEAVSGLKSTMPPPACFLRIFIVFFWGQNAKFGQRHIIFFRFIRHIPPGKDQLAHLKARSWTSRFMHYAYMDHGQQQLRHRRWGLHFQGHLTGVINGEEGLPQVYSSKTSWPPNLNWKCWGLHSSSQHWFSSVYEALLCTMMRTIVSTHR